MYVHDNNKLCCCTIINEFTFMKAQNTVDPEIFART